MRVTRRQSIPAGGHTDTALDLHSAKRETYPVALPAL